MNQVEPYEIPPPLEVRRLPIELRSDDRRVIAKLFILGSTARLHGIIERIGHLSDEEVRATLNAVLGDFKERHEDIGSIYEEHFRQVAESIGWHGELSPERRLLIGSYFTMEYAVEAAALFNPSIVPHPDQRALLKGQRRFIMSLRATGEGHVSSVVFRTGILKGADEVQLDPAPRFSATVRRSPDQYYHKTLFRRKLGDMAANIATMDLILNPLSDQFTLDELNASIIRARETEYRPPLFTETIESILWLARSNYQLRLGPQASIQNIVLFPHSESESRGIEDVRLVRFVEDDGAVMYYGTYSAYNGFRVLPMLLETPDFRTIKINTLNGACVRDKGMALFPRRINGHYCMCSRLDGQNLYLMYSDYVHFWESAERLATPEYPWEMMLIGNCGSPLETDAGWLLLTHGVGPMRRYCIGAMLLDRQDPRKVIGRLREPLIAPQEHEREGYVPNVVYSCGAIIHDGRLYIPFAMADSATTMASVDLEALLARLLQSPPR